MEYEYKKFLNREEMLKEVRKDRFFRFLVVPVFPIIGIDTIAMDTGIYKNIFSVWVFIIVFTYILSMIVLLNGIKKYSLNFKHTDVARSNAISACLMGWPYVAVPFYGIYISSYEWYLEMIIAISILIMINVLLFIHTHKLIVKNFSSFYYKLNGKIFFNQHVYKMCNEISKPYMAIFCIMIVITACYAMLLRSWNYPTGYAPSMNWSGFTLSFIVYPFLLRSIYILFVHARVEKHFNQRLLSDCWGFFELDPALAEKFFGPGPRIKRPIQYEEVFPTRNSQ